MFEEVSLLNAISSHWHKINFTLKQYFLSENDLQKRRADVGIE
jgi:hypothetical protein